MTPIMIPGEYVVWYVYDIRVSVIMVNFCGVIYIRACHRTKFN